MSFEDVGEIAQHNEFVLTPVDRQIAQIISAHRGSAQAITIEAIAQSLWLEEWYKHNGRQRCERAVKASVRRLRRAGWKIGSRRGENPGFFMIQNSRELTDTVRPLFRQFVDMARTIEALTGKQYYARELEGQMRLFS